MSGEFKTYICSRCGLEVEATERPEAMHWTDGHVCRIWIDKEAAERWNDDDPMNVGSDR